MQFIIMLVNTIHESVDINMKDKSMYVQCHTYKSSQISKSQDVKYCVMNY